MNTSIEEFMERVATDNTTGCWNWTGSAQSGTPTFGAMTARRFIFTKAHKQDPVGTIYTLCQNRKCVNPDHITDSQEEAYASRFNHYIDKRDNGCWIWTKGNTLSFVPGYNARQFAYQFYYEQAPKHSLIRAVCEEPMCVSPAHIYIYDRDALKGYETCIKGHPQIPGNMARNRRTGQVVCGVCLRQRMKESA